MLKNASATIELLSVDSASNKLTRKHLLTAKIRYSDSASMVMELCLKKFEGQSVENYRDVTIFNDSTCLATCKVVTQEVWGLVLLLQNYGDTQGFGMGSRSVFTVCQFQC